MKNRLLCLVFSVLFVFSGFGLDVFAIEPVKIETFNVSFQSGADLKDGRYIWSPTDSVSGHLFVYRINYSLSGVFSQDKGALRFEVPAHILKDRDGNWADKFDCPYVRESAVSEGDSPEFVYKIEGDKAVIYNYNPYPSGKAGYIEFGYSTTKQTYDYVDMSFSTDVKASVYATNDTQTVTKDAVAPAVGVDTHVGLTAVVKSVPDLYVSWPESFGNKPADADNYVYLLWPVSSQIGKCTGRYKFTIVDDFSAYGGSVVGYRFSGKLGFTTANFVDSSVYSGIRYDYVLTKHLKSEHNRLLDSVRKYQVSSNVKVTVEPVDKVDPVLSKSASRSWWIEKPEFVFPKGHFWAEKYGCYDGKTEVEDSEDVSNWDLEEFQSGQVDTLDGLIYHTYIEGFPYPWTLGDGADGTENDVLNGKYGQKKVDYELVDETFYLEGNTDALSDDAYNITRIDWSKAINDAIFDWDKMEFKPMAIESYKSGDDISIYAKMNGSWKLACMFDLESQSYKNVDTSIVTRHRIGAIDFVTGVKGVKLFCSNAYYHTKISVWPYVQLVGTQYVKNCFGDKQKVKVENEATGYVRQNGLELFSRTIRREDYVARSEKSSEIRKWVAKTWSDKINEQFWASWRIMFHEDVIGNEIRGVHQDSGTFYDLLPAGTIVDKKSLVVQSDESVLSQGSYSVEYIDNYKSSGRTLMILRISSPTNQYYYVDYDTSYAWNSIKDYGNVLLNSVVYESGNYSLAGGLDNQGGNVSDRNLLAGVSDNEKCVFLYAEAAYQIDILTAGSSGLMKQVRGPWDNAWKYDSITNQNGPYVYQIRLQNDADTTSKDLIFFDSLESFYQNENDVVETKVSDWKGTFQGIDVSQMKSKNIRPVVYLSKIDRMNIYNHHDLNEISGGEQVWLEYSEFEQKYGLENAHAIAVDARLMVDNSPFVLGKDESVTFAIYMKAPSRVDGTDSVTYNNIFVERSVMKEFDSSYVSQFFHQDYTRVVLRATGDVSFRKVSSVDYGFGIEGSKWSLRGISEYGTEYDEICTSDITGNVMFSNIEAGEYELIELECGSDWQLNRNVYYVAIANDGTCTIDCDTDKNGNNIIMNDSRVHGDLLFEKTDVETGDLLNNAKFMLSGTSDYGNDILLFGESGIVRGRNGRVVIKDIEKGTYKLSETQAPSGYFVDKTGWTVIVDGNGSVAMVRDGEELNRNENGYFIITNEPVHSVRFLKSSSYGENIYLSGAEFELFGTADDGTSVNLKALSGSSADGGLVNFNEVKSGTYTLRETKAPAEHEVDNTVHTVIVKRNGEVTIDGLNKSPFGASLVYDFKNKKTTGIVRVIKKWQDDMKNDVRVLPNITISTAMPKKSPLGNTVTFTSGKGTFEDGSTTCDVTYNSSGEIVDGELKKIDNGSVEESYEIFDGWLYNGYEVDLDLMTGNLTGDITLTPKYKTPPRYAVQLYDIAHDVDENGNTMGLTFGGATGADYRNTVGQHNATGVTASGNPKRCVHKDKWETIVEWNDKDPWVYEDCIDLGCTKAVMLDTKHNLRNSVDYECNVLTGDGPGILSYTILGQQNTPWIGVGSSFANNTSNFYGLNSWYCWAGCRFRAALNGTDELTQPDHSTWTLAPVNEYDMNVNSLFACFPKVLKTSIGRRRVGYTDVQGASLTTKYTYDYLWVPSMWELTQEDSFHNSLYGSQRDGSVFRRFDGVYTLQDANGNVSELLSLFDMPQSSGNTRIRMRTVTFERYSGGIYAAGTLAIHGNTVLNSLFSPYGMWEAYNVCFSLSRN